MVKNGSQSLDLSLLSCLLSALRQRLLSSLNFTDFLVQVSVTVLHRMSAVQARCPACPTVSPNENDDKKEDKEDSEDKHTTKHKHDEEEKTEGPWDFPNYEPFTIPPHWDRHCVQGKVFQIRGQRFV